MSPHAPTVSGRPPRGRPARRRTAVLAVSAAALAVAAGACDTSPVAASVNGVEIKQTALNQQLRLESANAPYVAAVSRAAASGQDGGITVAGDAPGTFSSRFVAGVLSTMVQAEAVHQHARAVGAEPGTERLQAARAVDEALFGSTWLSFPAAFRDAQVTADAEHAAIEPAPAQASVLRRAYASVQKYFFSSVCVRTIAVAVTHDGALDLGASLGQARNLVQQFNLTASDPKLGATLGTPQGGQTVCYDGQQLEAAGGGLFTTVLGLAPGHAAEPRQTSFGYSVVAVDRRLSLPFDDVTGRALALGVTEAQGSADPALSSVVAAARVTVDPQYGRWDPKRLAVIVSSPLGANSVSGNGPGASGGAAAGGAGGAGGAPAPSSGTP